MKGALVLAPEGGRIRGMEVDDFLAWVASVTRDQGFAIDTETTGLEWDCSVRLVQFGTAECGCAVDATQAAGVAAIRDALSLYRGPLIFHNAGYDIRQLAKLGIDPEYVWPRAVDTRTMAHVINSDRMSFRLKDLARTLLYADAADEQKELRKVMRKRKWGWDTVPKLLLAPYAVQDVLLTAQLYEYFNEQMNRDLWDVVDLEMSVAWAMWTVEQRGMKLDVDYATQLQATWMADLEDDRAYFKDQYGIDNPNANRQLAGALQNLGWVPSARTPRGDVKLDKEILKKLAPDYELVRYLLEYKRKVKWLAAYVENCLAQVDQDGFVHASYNSLGAKTGRMSCSNPPLQQLPKGGGGEVRRLFVASPGNLIASCDYSAIEMRLAGALSGEQRIIDIYLEGGDIYQQVADDIGCTRPQAKVVVLASLYGAGGPKIAAGLGITPAQGQRLVNGFWRAYPQLHRWVQHVMRQAQAGETVRSQWGRPLRPHAAYAAPNAIIQGTAAEVMKDGLLRLWEQGLLKYVCAVVHDEVVLDVPAAEAGDIAERVAKVMECHDYKVPLTAEASVYGVSWGDGYAE